MTTPTSPATKPKKKTKKLRKKAAKKVSSLLAALSTSTKSTSSSTKPKPKQKKKKAKKTKAKTKPTLVKRPVVIGASLSCGMLLCQRGADGVPLVLVLWRKDGSPDLPKGHVKPGETDRAAALRELQEETGISSSRVRFSPAFVFENTYRTKNKKVPGALINKTVRVFHAEVDGPVVVEAHEHAGYAWLRMDDARALQREVHDNPTFVGALKAWASSASKQSSSSSSKR